MNAKYYSKTLNNSERFDIHLFYKHLYVENTSLLAGANIQILSNKEVIFELPPNSYIDMKDVFRSVDTTKIGGDLITVFDSAGLGATFKLLNYGI